MNNKIVGTEAIHAIIQNIGRMQVGPGYDPDTLVLTVRDDGALIYVDGPMSFYRELRNLYSNTDFSDPNSTLGDFPVKYVKIINFGGFVSVLGAGTIVPAPAENLKRKPIRGNGELLIDVLEVMQRGAEQGSAPSIKYDGKEYIVGTAVPTSTLSIFCADVDPERILNSWMIVQP